MKSNNIIVGSDLNNICKIIVYKFNTNDIIDIFSTMSKLFNKESNDGILLVGDDDYYLTIGNIDTGIEVACYRYNKFKESYNIIIQNKVDLLLFNKLINRYTSDM